MLAMAAAIGDVEAGALRAYSRRAEMCELRFAAFLALHEHGMSSPQIGRLFGGRDHSSVLHGIGRARALASVDPDFVWLVDALRAAARQPLWQRVDPAILARFIPPDLKSADLAEPESDRDADEDEHPRPLRERQAEARDREMMARGSAALAAAVRTLRGGSNYNAVTGGVRHIAAG